MIIQSGYITVCYREYGDYLRFERIADKALIMTDDLIYNERVFSNKTEGLFLALTTLFFLLLTWRVNAGNVDLLAAVFFCLFGLFLFYSVNSRTLIIRLTPESLKLTFGIFTWIVPLDNVEDVVSMNYRY